MNLGLFGSNRLEYKMMDGVIDMKILIHHDINELMSIYSDQLG